MSEILLTSSLTILGGVLIFVTGQIAVKFFIEPFHAYKKLIGEITHSLTFYANAGSFFQEDYLQQLEKVSELDSPRREIIEQRLKETIVKDWKLEDDAKITLRKQASQLMNTANMIPMFKLWAFIRVLPKHDSLLIASSNLIGLSNSIGSFDWSKRKQDIVKHLRIKVITD